MGTLAKSLIEVQSKLKAPKGQYNSFGKYHYRSAEDVLEAVKPLLAEQGLLLTINDEIVTLGDRYYVKATATITNGEDEISCVAYAREEESKKGYDGSQVTGASSSYARKYALNGLFCIDDAKDSDYTNTGQKAAKTATNEAKADDNPLLDMAMSDAANAYSLEALKEVWNNHSGLHHVQKFRDIVNKRKSELSR